MTGDCSRHLRPRFTYPPSRALECCALSLVFWLTACTLGTEELVPATVSDDPRLPVLELSIAGARRSLHLESVGPAGAPVLLVYHGAAGSDYRAMLPLLALADRYRVVLWDGLGSGLSERLAQAEFSLELGAQELHAVKQHFSPDAPVSYVGYSSGGPYGAMWLQNYPQDLDQLVLIESDALDSATRDETAIDIPLGASWVHEALWQNEFLTPNDHAEADYKLFVAARPALEGLSCDPKHPSHYPMWRMGAAAYVASNELLDGRDFQDDIRALGLDALLIATRCGPLNADFQREHLAPLFVDAQIVELGHPADHLNLFEQATDEILSALRSYLRAYQEEK